MWMDNTMGAMPQQPAAPMPQNPQGGLDPQMVQQVLALQRQGPQAAAIARQRKLADAMRGDAAGQLQGRQAGAIYRAPGALNVAANVLGNIKAQRLGADADVREGNMSAETQAAMQRYFDAITGQKRQPMPYMGAEGE